VADWDSLENCCTCKRTVGSNPTPSAIIRFSLSFHSTRNPILRLNRDSDLQNKNPLQPKLKRVNGVLIFC
jgi:hypothetical protein